MEMPPHPAPGRLGVRLAKPPLPAHPQAVITGSVNSSKLTLFDPLVVITGSVNSSKLTLFDPLVVITGSVNSSELTLFDPVIHASRYTWMAGSRFVLRPAKPVRWARLGQFEAN